MVTEHDGAGSLEGLRRYTWWSFVCFVPVMVGMPLLWGAPDLAGGSPVVPVALFVALSVVAAPVVPLLNAALRREQRWPGRGMTAAVGAGAVVALVLPWVAPAEPIAAWTVPAAGLLGVALMHVPMAWTIAGGAAGVVVLTALAGGAAAVREVPVAPNLVATAVFTAVFVTASVGSWWIWRIAVRLDAAREAEADLAVARERLRFAADLHDLQGHHLQVITLKGDLLARLVGVDDDAARREAGEVAAIARTALAETRAVVQGYRQADLATEVGNAVAVLEAAGITAAVDGEPAAVPAAHAALFGALVREGTTNVLRHSRATAVHLDVGPDRLALRNDAPRAARHGDGTGIAGLRERFEVAGGGVEVSREDGWFELRGHVR